MAIVLAALWYFASLPDKALDRADRLGSVGSMITGLLALLVALVSARMAVQPHTASAPKDVIEPKRVWNAPIRNRMFLGREELLKSLRRQLRTGGSAVIQALHGMGGVGKTQIALEYAHRYANDYDLVWWFASEKTELIGDQYLTLAIDAELVTPESDVKTAFNKVRSHLKEHNRWLLLFDNAEDPAELRSWLPSGEGHVVITSRNPGWNEVAAPVPVDVFTRKESIALIQTQLSHLPEEAADRLAEALGDLPLGLAQAIGTIAETGMTVAEYEEALAAKASQVLAESTPPTYPIPLAAAVRLSADRLAAEDPTAGDILSLCAWLAPDPIPVSLFVVADDTPLAAHRAVARIARFGLAIVDGDRGLQLHRLTQAILRDFTGENVRDRVEALLVGAGPENGSDPKYWSTWAWLVPHIIALKPADSTNDDLRDVACRMLWYLLNRGEFAAAQSLAEQFRNGWLSRYGSDDPALLWATNHLAEAYRNLGEHSKARPLYREVYERNRAIHSDDHSHTLTCANNLASNMHALGELMEARVLQEETLRRRRLLLGEDSPQALTSANNLANILRDLGDLQAAHDLHHDTLIRRRRVLGEDHLRTLRTANSLADDLRELGNFEAACDLYQDTYGRQKRVLGEDHPDTLATASSLVVTLRVLGNTKDAQKLERWVVVRKRKLAVKKSDIAQSAPP